MPEVKIVKLVYDVSPPVVQIHLFMKGSGREQDPHEIVGFHGYDKDGKLVYGAGLSLEEITAATEFTVKEPSEN